LQESSSGFYFEIGKKLSLAGGREAINKCVTHPSITFRIFIFDCQTEESVKIKLYAWFQEFIAR
jgi:hypothetical protein